MSRRTRYGDFSRQTFDPRKGYTGVFMQQGRVQLDADWNEQAEIVAHQLRTQAADLVGPGGAPAGSSGFQIVARSSLHFDGEKQYLTLGHGESQLYGAAVSLTIDLHVRPSSSETPGALVTRFDRQGKAALEYGYLLAVRSDGRLRFHRAGGGRELISERPIRFGRWNRVTLSHDESASRLFIDGEIAGVLGEGFGGPAPAGAEPRSSLFLVGLAQLKESGPLAFEGTLRGVRLWSRAFAPGDRLWGSPEELLGDWPFDRGGLEDVVLDRSRHANHAILGGGKPELRPTLQLDDLLVSAGRYYVGGVPCENAEATRFEAQPDLPGALRPEPSTDRAYLFYLDAWEREIDAAEEPALREVALGGADTALRTRLVTQAKWIPVELGATDRVSPSAIPEWSRLTAREERSGRLRARRPVGAPGSLGNHVYRVEVHDAGGAYGWPRRPAQQEVRLEVESVSGEEVRIGGSRELAEVLGPGHWVELFSARTDSEGVAGHLRQLRAVDAENRTAILDAEVGDLDGDDSIVLRRLGTWKWSRSNGSVSLAVRHLEEGSRVASVDAAPGGGLPVETGSPVELLDHRLIVTGTTAPLLSVKTVDDRERSVTLERAPADSDGAGGPRFLRVWDGAGPLRSDDWQTLENGIEIRFDAGDYAHGDSWCFASRSATDRIDWPLADGEPAPRPAERVDHHLSPLALLRFGDRGFELVDCRPTFQPLTSGAVSKAGDRMHGPLEIRLDGEASPSDQPALRVEGVAEVETLLGPLGSPAAVRTFNLAEGAVSDSKLAPDVGIVPAGHSILGESREPPPGYTATGFALTMPNAAPEWERRARLEIGETPTELHSAAVGGLVMSFSNSGRTWSYDPVTAELRERRPMPEPRSRFAVAAADGSVFVVGGVDDRDEKLSSTLAYDPAADAWTWREAMATARSDLALVESGGRLYALGGLRDVAFFEIVTRLCEVYDPRVDDWQRTRDLPTARYGMSAGAAGRGLVALGGRRRWFLRWLGRAVTAVNEEYLPGVDRWSRRRNLMPAPRCDGGTARVGDSIYVIGGRSLFGWTEDVTSFNPKGDAWESATPLPGPVVSPGVAAVGGRLIVLAPGPEPDTLVVDECRIAAEFHVHTKSAAPPGDLEPQLVLPPPVRRALEEGD